MVEETNHLTVLDMLDVLETEIGLLRGQNQSLTAALSNARDQGEIRLGTPPKKRRAGARKTKKKKTPKRPRASALERAGAPIQGDPATKEDRVLGKRQALGKSLLQLRRVAAAPQPECSAAVDDQQDVFHSS
jgi:hypothetical protein